jgi:hypothetical protein
VGRRRPGGADQPVPSTPTTDTTTSTTTTSTTETPAGGDSGGVLDDLLVLVGLH